MVESFREMFSGLIQYISKGIDDRIELIVGFLLQITIIGGLLWYFINNIPNYYLEAALPIGGFVLIIGTMAITTPISKALEVLGRTIVGDVFRTSSIYRNTLASHFRRCLAEKTGFLTISFRQRFPTHSDIWKQFISYIIISIIWLFGLIFAIQSLFQIMEPKPEYADEFLRIHTTLIGSTLIVMVFLFNYTSETELLQASYPSAKDLLLVRILLISIIFSLITRAYVSSIDVEGFTALQLVSLLITSFVVLMLIEKAITLRVSKDPTRYFNSTFARIVKEISFFRARKIISKKKLLNYTLNISPKVAEESSAKTEIEAKELELEPGDWIVDIKGKSIEQALEDYNALFLKGVAARIDRPNETIVTIIEDVDKDVKEGLEDDIKGAIKTSKYWCPWFGFTSYKGPEEEFGEHVALLERSVKDVIEQGSKSELKRYIESYVIAGSIPIPTQKTTFTDSIEYTISGEILESLRRLLEYQKENNNQLDEEMPQIIEKALIRIVSKFNKNSPDGSTVSVSTEGQSVYLSENLSVEEEGGSLIVKTDNDQQE